MFSTSSDLFCYFYSIRFLGGWQLYFYYNTPLLITFFYLSAFELIYFGYLSIENYPQVANVMFTISPFFILIGTIGNVLTLKLSRGLLFSLGELFIGILGSLIIPFFLFWFVLGKLYITSPLCHALFAKGNGTFSRTPRSVDPVKRIFSKSNNSTFSDYMDDFVTHSTSRYHEYTGGSIKKYDYVSEDIFGHIQLRGDDGEDIEVYQDGDGNYRRMDNDKLIY